MDFNYRQNPYKNARTPIIVTKPMLTHGDENYSLCKYLSKKKRLYTSQEPATDRQVEQQILWKYQKQYYGYDQNGYSLAEWNFERKVLQNTQRQGILQVPFFGGKIQRDKNTRSETASTRSLENHFLEENRAKFSTQRQAKPQVKSPKQRNRREIKKIKRKIQQIEGGQLRRENNIKICSVLSLYKAKKPLEYFPGLITFGELEPNSNTQMNQKKIESNTELSSIRSDKRIHPQSIFINKQHYFKIPFI